MKRIMLLVLITVTTGYSQGVINIQPGSGVPTDMAVGGLLGAIIAPMVSKGSDAKLVGGALGALAGGMYGTANQQIQQQRTAQQQQIAYQQWAVQFERQMQLEQQMARMQQQMANMNTASGGMEAREGIQEGKMVRSPYSKFKIEPKSMNLDSGDVMYDPFNGKPFRIP